LIEFDGLAVFLSKEENTMAELKQDPTHPLKHEQCYLCFTTLVEPPPANAPTREELRRPHKEYMARLESDGRLFGAGLLKNDKEKETSDLGFGMFILRAETRAEAEAIAFQEPNTKAGLRTMKVIPWARGEGDINISISFTNGTVKIDRRSYLLDNG
jgi:uncharacterized protein YciI